MGGQTDEHAGVGAGQSRWRGARMLHRVPRRLQQEPMLRIHQPDLARRHAEEWRVEPRHVIDETRTTGHDLAGRTDFLVEELVDVPPVLGHLGYRVAAIAQHVPEPIGIRGARETRCIADDGKACGRLDRMLGESHTRCSPCFLPRRSECESEGVLTPLITPSKTIAREPVAHDATRSGFSPRDRDGTEGMLSHG